MTFFATIRNILDTQIFPKFGFDIAIKTVTYTLNDRGERTEDLLYVENTVKGVRYNQVKNYFKGSYGVLDADESSLVLPYDTVVSRKDTLEVNDVDYSIVSIEPIPNEENKVAYILTLTKKF